MLGKNKTGRRPESSSPTAEKVQYKGNVSSRRNGKFHFHSAGSCLLHGETIRRKHEGFPVFFWFSSTFLQFLYILIGKACFPSRNLHKKAVRYGLYRTAVQSLSGIAHRTAYGKQGARPCRSARFMPRRLPPRLPAPRGGHGKPQ